MSDQQAIRNFCIIAHIDHGKSTLADRFLELTRALPAGELKEQTLDTMDLERERGITIKLQPARMEYQGVQLNLIDTPGHADFNYEVSRSLAAVEGAILLVDASQGIQAQTLFNLELARTGGLTIIPAINKIDLPTARVQVVEEEIKNLLGEGPILRVSAKTGAGVPALLEEVIKTVPPPLSTSSSPPRALIFDSFFDGFRGVIAYVRQVDGMFHPGDKLLFMGTNVTGEAQELGYLQLKRISARELAAGEIGYIVTGLKDVRACRVGDTITLAPRPEAVQAVTGYQPPRSMVFAGFYSSDGAGTKLRTALEKLQLNDAALQFVPHHSGAFGFGFTCGFLGLLHLEITKERLAREFDIEPIITIPSVEYKYEGDSPLEPWVAVEAIAPQKNLGAVTHLLQEARGVSKDVRFLGERVILDYEAPLGEIITGFYDRLKSATQGYGSLSYEFLEYRPGDLVTLEVAIAQELVEALTQIVPRVKMLPRARAIALALKDLIPRQLFEVRIQVKVGGKILASESVPPLRKDVTAKLYGGDVTRKRKLLEKQKAGKARLRAFGRVALPTDVFLNVLKRIQN